jgi:Mrp family chromosome partitioning ATPase
VFRSLRSTVKFSSGERPIRSVLVVDIDREQRSGVADELATAFAEAGDRCLLIDTDVRGTVDRTDGFFDLLRGDISLDSIATTADGERLMRIGPGRNGSPDALAGDAFVPTIERLTEEYGISILSAASLPRYADALAIAPRVDAVILVVTSGRTSRPRAIEARDALDRVGARILGVVMVEPKKRWFW